MLARTIIDRIEIEPQTGNVGVGMKKQVLADDGVTVLSEQFHRTMLAPGTDAADQMSRVNVHLGMMGFPAVKTEDRAVLDTALGAIETLRSAKLAEALEAEAAKA